MDTDRVISGAPDGRLYRVIAGEAYSWTTLLIEDQLGERFVFDTVSHALTPIGDDLAISLVETRSYRPWNGPSRWASMQDLTPAEQWPSRPIGMPGDFDDVPPDLLDSR